MRPDFSAGNPGVNELLKKGHAFGA
jgi:hypothetical protein